jgi:hypothetical protein
MIIRRRHTANFTTIGNVLFRQARIVARLSRGVESAYSSQGHLSALSTGVLP